MEAVQPLEDNPESILHNRRKGTGVRKSAKAPARPQSPVPSHPDRPVQSIEALPRMDQGSSDYDIAYENSEGESSIAQDYIDPVEAFKKWGYLPPFDAETAAVIDTIIDDPISAMELVRRNPTSDQFYEGLENRNVSLKESTTPDIYADINHLAHYPLQETDAERESHEHLWTLDRAKCYTDGNEALFQRTLMMGFIARHSLIHGQVAAGPFCLDFSVEETWICPPMPTIDYYLSRTFLTQPKPDLAVCFKRDMVITKDIWFPYATEHLACYEKSDRRGNSKAFHFFTIQDRREDPRRARYQNLNNASQALHNMFEFFQDAGPRHRANFFSQVRFFSAVASPAGLDVYIHRAIDEGENHSGNDCHVPGYPLRFEFQALVTIEDNRFADNKFDRKTVLELFGKILVSYGVERLQGLLQDAARDLWEKLKNDPEEYRLRGNVDFYRHGQFTNTQRDMRESELKQNAYLYRSGQVSNTPGSGRTALLTALRSCQVQSPVSAETAERNASWLRKHGYANAESLSSYVASFRRHAAWWNNDTNSKTTSTINAGSEPRPETS